VEDERHRLGAFERHILDVNWDQVNWDEESYVNLTRAAMLASKAADLDQPLNEHRARYIADLFTELTSKPLGRKPSEDARNIEYTRHDVYKLAWVAKLLETDRFSKMADAVLHVDRHYHAELLHPTVNEAVADENLSWRCLLVARLAGCVADLLVQGALNANRTILPRAIFFPAKKDPSSHFQPRLFRSGVEYRLAEGVLVWRLGNKGEEVDRQSVVRLGAGWRLPPSVERVYAETDFLLAFDEDAFGDLDAEDVASRIGDQQREILRRIAGLVRGLSEEIPTETELWLPLRYLGGLSERVKEELIQTVLCLLEQGLSPERMVIYFLDRTPDGTGLVPKYFGRKWLDTGPLESRDEWIERAKRVILPLRLVSAVRVESPAEGPPIGQGIGAGTPPEGHGLAAWAYVNKKPALAADARRDARAFLPLEGFGSQISVAVFSSLKRDPVGVITAASSAGESFEKTDLSCLLLVGRLLGDHFGNVSHTQREKTIVADFLHGEVLDWYYEIYNKAKPASMIQQLVDDFGLKTVDALKEAALSRVDDKEAFSRLSPGARKPEMDTLIRGILQEGKVRSQTLLVVVDILNSRDISERVGYADRAIVAAVREIEQDIRPLVDAFPLTKVNKRVLGSYIDKVFLVLHGLEHKRMLQQLIGQIRQEVSRGTFVFGQRGFKLRVQCSVMEIEWGSLHDWNRSEMISYLTQELERTIVEMERLEEPRRLEEFHLRTV